MLPPITGLKLLESLQSVLAQTYMDFETIVVNDGSTENTKKVAGDFNDPRIRYPYQENKGVSAARNSGINDLPLKLECL